MIRKILRVSGMVVLVSSLCVGLYGFSVYFSMMSRHAAKDSEGGTFVYGMMALVYIGSMFIGNFFGSVLWGIGISNRPDTTRKEKVERIFQRTFLILSSLPIFALIARLVFMQLKHA